jgi:hypothetical protein
LLVGREEQRQDFLAALEDGPGSPGRATIYTGARGTGKTVLLNAIEEDARRLGWLVVSETATPGLVRRLSTEALPRLLAEQDPNATKSRMTGFTLPAALGGVTWDTSDVHQAVAGLRPQLTLLTKILAENETGLVITVDELHRRPLDELVELCAAVQHAFREEMELAFVGAGLPAAVSDLLNEDVLTFLRRAERYHVGKVSREDVRLALETPIRDGRRSIETGALDYAVDATGGYPFLIQLVGHSIWRQRPANRLISIDDAEAGVEQARRRLGSLVHDPSLSVCSDTDKTFLLAMAVDDGPSRVGDIAQRLNASANYTSQYRLRLIEAELIEPAGWGKIDFALPYLREYLREHAAIERPPDRG